MTPRRAPGLCCVNITQLMTYPVIYKLLLTLQLCYKPLVIQQGVTESQKIYILSPDRLQKFITPTFLTIGPMVSQSEEK